MWIKIQSSHLKDLVLKRDEIKSFQKLHERIASLQNDLSNQKHTHISWIKECAMLALKLEQAEQYIKILKEQIK